MPPKGGDAVSEKNGNGQQLLSKRFFHENLLLYVEYVATRSTRDIVLRHWLRELNRILDSGISAGHTHARRFTEDELRNLVARYDTDFGMLVLDPDAAKREVIRLLTELLGLEEEFLGPPKVAEEVPPFSWRRR